MDRIGRPNFGGYALVRQLMGSLLAYNFTT
jgi:hypothetical protein